MIGIFALGYGDSVIDAETPLLPVGVEDHEL